VLVEATNGRRSENSTSGRVGRSNREREYKENRETC
jgi:hypothetical protein